MTHEKVRYRKSMKGVILYSPLVSLGPDLKFTNPATNWPGVKLTTRCGHPLKGFATKSAKKAFKKI